MYYIYTCNYKLKKYLLKQYDIKISARNKYNTYIHILCVIKYFNIVYICVLIVYICVLM